MAMTYFRVNGGPGGPASEAGTTKEVQSLLRDAPVGEYTIDLITADRAGGEGSSQHWGRAIKHQDGAVHLESDMPGE
ncbi:hypothetical protein OJF2_47990 [Aquisphaera giovannonii]|uniref:Uncharacterized protein n=1 Tax=Aquisphaera giovannonii TaxID=406548 RepID=A0A5B9W7X6_9BACT|nr:hypothetical protein [Aquisphaera giovannonii]QEH36239.1 hypothetical protein OJF2_47990 [Aquisphaera giovannonii]